MAKKYWRQRCGQCGRSYNKAQWRRNDFWCPECKKFVCYDCVTRGLICPACGSEVKRKVKSLLYNGFAIGVAFMFPSSLMLVVSRPGSEIFWIAVIFISISGILFILGGISFGIVRNRTKRHNAFVARLPKGMIPFNQRAGYGNPVVYVKWKEANLERSPRRSILMRGAYPDFKWTGLSGDWDYPIVSREERIQMTSVTRKRGSHLGVGMVVFGVVMLSLGIVNLLQPVAAYGFGTISILFGLLVLTLVSIANKAVEGDEYGETKVTWKTIGFKAAKRAVEEFIRGKGWEINLTTNELPMWQHPEHKYKLPDGNYISFTYSEDSSGHVWGWVAVGYKSSNYSYARKLRLDLDEFLSERDLISRAG